MPQFDEVRSFDQTIPELMHPDPSGLRPQDRFYRFRDRIYLINFLACLTRAGVTSGAVVMGLLEPAANSLVAVILAGLVKSNFHI